MAKTQEELNEIKKECEELGKKLSELTDEELSSVVGGSGGESERYIKPDFFTGHVPAENVKVDGYYYFTYDDEDI